MKYQVIVGNVGTAHDGNNKKVAYSSFREYRWISKNIKGMRASGEQVTLMMNGEPIMDYIPESDIID